MPAIKLVGTVDEQHRLSAQVPVSVPPGPVEVVLVLTPAPPREPVTRLRWEDAYGLGKEIWQGIDAQEYVDTLRSEWEQRRP